MRKANTGRRRTKAGAAILPAWSEMDDFGRDGKRPPGPPGMRRPRIEIRGCTNETRLRGFHTYRLRGRLLLSEQASVSGFVPFCPGISPGRGAAQPCGGDRA